MAGFALWTGRTTRETMTKLNFKVFRPNNADLTSPQPLDFFKQRLESAE